MVKLKLVSSLPEKPKQPEIAVIIWDDAVASCGWMDHPADEKPHRCTSVGLVVFEDAEHIVLAGSWSTAPEGVMQTNNRISIPASWVRSRRVIRNPEAKR